MRDVIERAMRAASQSIDLRRRVGRALGPTPKRRSRVGVIAVGKAALPMLAGARSMWRPFIDAALAIVPDGSRLADPTGVELMHASHPLPDARSVAAATRALEFARETKGMLLVLVSGGASSLLCAPIADLSLGTKQEITERLLLSGATISEVNTVRRHLSRIKGGGLTQAAAPARVMALIASDVIDGSPHDVGSGPTLPDPSTVEDARSILFAHASSYRSAPLRETLKPGDPAAPLQTARILADPTDFADEIARALAEEGISTAVFTASRDEVEKLADEYELIASTLAPGRAVVRAAEPRITVPSGSPPGGRCHHLAAIVGARLPPGLVFAAIATDGVDGATESSGAIVDSSFVERAGGRPNVVRHVESFAATELHRLAGTVLAGGPSDLNFADVHILARLPA